MKLVGFDSTLFQSALKGVLPPSSSSGLQFPWGFFAHPFDAAFAPDVPRDPLGCARLLAIAIRKDFARVLRRVGPESRVAEVAIQCEGLVFG